ncbi:MAG TPA: GNAT family N-acetyltransferase [Gaiellaceae bacterium]|nr:GNAT family N-acetyltransferase [Gaiellaceae bacterium]
MIRPYREADGPAVDALLAAAWPDDPVMAEISSQHRVDGEDGEGRSWRTLVADEAGTVAGVGSLVASARHPSRYFCVVAVAPERRRRGLGWALLAGLRSGGDGRPLQARVRASDEAGLAFLRAHGFGSLMRSRTGVVDPGEATEWIERNAGGPLRRPSREEAARLHEAAYAFEHASWSPVAERPLEESLRLFCGESWLPESAGAAATGIASLHGPPLAPSTDELFLIAGTWLPGEPALRALVAAAFAHARERGATVSIEADEANRALWRILGELPARLDPDVCLLATDAA